MKNHWLMENFWRENDKRLSKALKHRPLSYVVKTDNGEFCARPLSDCKTFDQCLDKILEREKQICIIWIWRDSILIAKWEKVGETWVSAEL